MNDPEISQSSELKESEKKSLYAKSKAEKQRRGVENQMNAW